MKRSKLLVGVLVASIALLGTGYAYWTDQLTLDATVNTGELNVRYVAVPTLTTGELQEQIGNPSTPEVPEVPEIPDQPAIYEKIVITSLSEWNGEGTPGWDKHITKNYKSVTLWTTNGFKCYYFYGDTGKNNKPGDDYTWVYGVAGVSSGWYTQTNFRTGCFQNDPACRYYTVLVSDEIPGTPGTPGIPAVPGTSSETVVDGDGYINKYDNPTAELIGDLNKGINIKLNNFYPGSFANVTFTAENSGTIPAVIDTVNVRNLNMITQGEKNFADQLKVVVTVSVPGSEVGVFNPITDADLANAKSLSKVAEVLENAYANARLEKGQMITTRLTIIFPGKAAIGDEFENLNEEQGTAQTFGLDINWIQHNALITEKPEV